MGKKQLAQRQIKHIVYLRKRGHSLPEIRRITNHSNGTIFKYIEGVKILPSFQAVWKEKRKPSILRSKKEWQRAEAQAGKLIRNITGKEKILIAASLYWAEGAKGDFSLSNTDPALVKTFVSCLKELGIEKENLSINLRIYEDLNRNTVCNFWAKTIGIPKGKIAYVNILKGKKHGKLKYGMCRIRVIRGGYFLKLLHSIKNIIIKDYSAPVVQ